MLDVELPTPDFSEPVGYLAGVRPYHLIKPQIRYELIASSAASPKMLVHNYGHGGAGWIYSLGSRQLCMIEIAQGLLALHGQNKDDQLHQLSRLERCLTNDEQAYLTAIIQRYKSMQVAVIGAGLNGLLIAQALREAGLKVTILSERFTPHTTSDVAGGITPPPMMGKSSLPPLCDQLMMISLGAYKERALRGDPEIYWVDSYVIGHDLGFALLAKKELIQAAREVRIKLGAKAYEGFHYHSLLIDPELEMPRLQQAVQALGVSMIQRTITSRAEINQLPADLIVNCTGIGAKALVPDEQLIAYQGLLIKYKAQPAVHYTLLADAEDGSCIYWIGRKNSLLLGGTFTPNVDRMETSPSECAPLIERANVLLGYR